MQVVTSLSASTVEVDSKRLGGSAMMSDVRRNYAANIRIAHGTQSLELVDTPVFGFALDVLDGLRSIYRGARRVEIRDFYGEFALVLQLRDADQVDLENLATGEVVASSPAELKQGMQEFVGSLETTINNFVQSDAAEPIESLNATIDILRELSLSSD